MNSDYNKVWEVMNDLEMVTSKICSAREIIDTAAEAIQKHEYDKAETLAMAAYEFLEYYLKDFDEKFKLAWQETVVKQKKEEDPCMSPWGHSDLEYLSKHKKPVSCDKDDTSPECKGAWDSFWEDVNNWTEKDNEVKADGYSVNGESHSKYYYDYTRNDPNRLNPFSGKVYESPDGGKTVYARNPGETERTLVKETVQTRWILPVQETKLVDTDETEYFVSFPQDLLEAADLKEGDAVHWIDNNDGSYTIRKSTKQLGMDEC